MDRQIAKAQALARKRRRIRKRISGTPERPRLSVYRSERHIYAQLIDDVAGRTLAAASSMQGDLRAPGDPTATARRVGEAVAEKALGAGIARAVFDRGGRNYTGRIAALADGARSKGLQL